MRMKGQSIGIAVSRHESRFTAGLGLLPFILAAGIVVVTACGGNPAIKDAQAFEKRGEFDRAVEILKVEIQTGTKDADVNLYLARLQLISGARHDGLSTLKDLIAAGGKSAQKNVEELFLTLAEEGVDEGRDADWALFCIENAAGLNRDQIEPTIQWLRSGKARNAYGAEAVLKYLKFLASSAPDSREIIASNALSEAKIAKKENELRTACKLAIVAGQNDPAYLEAASEVIAESSISLADQNEWGTARRFLDKAASWNPKLQDEDRFFWYWRVVSEGGALRPQGVSGAKKYLERFPGATDALAAKNTIDLATKYELFWPFEGENAAARLVDRSGTGTSASYCERGALEPVTGVLGSGLSNDDLSCIKLNRDLPRGDGNWTFLVWIKLSDSPLVDYHRIYWDWKGRYKLTLTAVKDGQIEGFKLRFFSEDGSIEDGTGLDRVFPGKHDRWHLFAYQRDGDVFRAFVDGELVGEMTRNVAENRLSDSEGGYIMVDGFIDEFRVALSQLSAEEIRQVFICEFPGDPGQEE